MFSLSRIVGSVSVVVLLFAGSVTAAPKWIELRSANFLLAGDAGDFELRQVARRLEEFREALTRLAPNAHFERAPTIVLVFANEKGYRAFTPRYEGKPIEADGFCQPGRDVNYLTMMVNGREDVYPIIFHEFTHLFIQSNMPTEPPLWFNEGLADYYSTFGTGDSRHANVGKPLPGHVALLRDRWVPLSQVLSAARDSPLYNISRDRNIFYAESWALVHYLLLGPADRRTQLFAFLEKVAAGVPRDQAVRDSFGSSTEQLEKELQAYLRQFAFTYKTITFTNPIDGKVGAPVRAMTDAQVEARLGDLLVNMNRPDEAETRLQNALRLDPSQALALVSLADLRMRQDKQQEAIKLLERAVASDPQNYDAHLRHGRALLEQTKEQAPDVVSAAGKAYARALELRPESAEAMSGIAWTLLMSEERMEEARSLAERAMKAEPNEPKHRWVLAQVYASQRNFQSARSTLGPLMAWEKVEVREQARSLMGKIAEYERAMAAAAERTAAMATSATTTHDPASVPDRSRMRDGENVPALRQIKEGEQRAFGTLVAIECSQKSAVIVVKTSDAAVRLRVGNLTAIEFITYRTDLSGRIGCGQRKTADPVYATWRGKPSVVGPSKTDGEAVAVEFLPKDYVPKQDK